MTVAIQTLRDTAHDCRRQAERFDSEAARDELRAAELRKFARQARADADVYDAACGQLGAADRAGTDGHILRTSGNALEFGSPATPPHPVKKADW